MVVNYRINTSAIRVESWLHDPNEGGGRIIGGGCHFVDFCTALIGSEPVAVMANSISSNRRDVVWADSIVITIQYGDGSLATSQYLAEGHKDMRRSVARYSRTARVQLWTIAARPRSTAGERRFVAGRPRLRRGVTRVPGCVPSRRCLAPIVGEHSRDTPRVLRGHV